MKCKYIHPITVSIKEIQTDNPINMSFVFFISVIFYNTIKMH